jgi:predicted metalloprotease with PDZ domain
MPTLIKIAGGALGTALNFFCCAVLAQQPTATTLQLSVDATDLNHRVLHAVEKIPVTAGSQTLFYPEWLPGTHSTAFSSVRSLAGLRFTANGQTLTWTRDTVDMGEFHLEVPAGVTMVTAEFDFLTLSATQGDNARVTISPDIVDIEWHSVVLYPKGPSVSEIPIKVDLKLPQGFDFGSALEVASRNGANVQFKTVDLSTLVDSPLLAGRYFKKFDLDPGASVPVSLDVAADREEDLKASDAALAQHRALVQQAYKLFGSRHYDHYDFLLSLSAQIGEIGLEHHQSSEDGWDESYFTEYDSQWDGRDLLPHEYTHSWNGKFRRPEDLTTPNYNVPMKDTLLWMYEGQTQFWGKALAARSGIISLEHSREQLAFTAAYYQALPGRLWRNLQDTTNQEILVQHGSPLWPTWQRSADYYDEMVLVWLDVDTRIREASNDTRSLDDFAKLFFGVDNGSHKVKTYTLDDIVAALNQIQPMDWKTLLRTRLDQHQPGAILDGITRSGWKLVYNDQKNEVLESSSAHDGSADYSFSIGISVDKEKKIREVRWDSPAFRAGLAPGDYLVAVDNRAFKKEVMSDAIVAAEHDKAALQLLVRDGDLYRTVSIDYHDGLQLPHLVRIEGRPDYLTELYSAK